MCPCLHVGGGVQGISEPHLPSIPLCPPENVFGSSPGTHRLRRKQTTLSQPVSATFSLPALEEADAEEKEAFQALVGQMGTGHSLSE